MPSNLNNINTLKPKVSTKIMQALLNFTRQTIISENTLDIFLTTLGFTKEAKKDIAFMHHLINLLKNLPPHVFANNMTANVQGSEDQNRLKVIDSIKNIIVHLEKLKSIEEKNNKLKQSNLILDLLNDNETKNTKSFIKYV